MMTFAWHRPHVGEPYPALWHVKPPDRSEGDPGSRSRIVQAHPLTDEQERELDTLANGVSRIDYLRAKFPYVAPPEEK